MMHMMVAPSTCTYKLIASFVTGHTVYLLIFDFMSSLRSTVGPAHAHKLHSQTQLSLLLAKLRILTITYTLS